jgi:uncharacterized protein YgiM (DUF1202 family)
VLGGVVVNHCQQPALCAAPYPACQAKPLDLTPHFGYTPNNDVGSDYKPIYLMKGLCLMKSLILSITCIVLLTSCSSHAPATGTAKVPLIQTQLTTPTQTELPVPTQTEPPIPTDTPTPAPTPNAVRVCVLPDQLNLRTGPGTTYDVAGVIKKGTCIFAIARNSNNTWFWVILNDYNGWVTGTYLSTKGDLNTLPIVTEFTQTLGAVTQNPVPSKTIQP